MRTSFWARIWVGLVCVSLLSGCASTLPKRDYAGKRISDREINAHKKKSNIWVYMVGGGALSFGASFFLGFIVERGNDGDGKSALWGTTLAGTALGMAYFAHRGHVRDVNIAIQKARHQRKKRVSHELSTEKEKQKKLESERTKLERQKAAQDAERKRLLEEIRKKKQKDNNN